MSRGLGDVYKRQDRELVHASLDALRLGEGSAIGDAIATAVQLTRKATGTRGGEGQKAAPPAAVIFLVSDGARDGGRDPAVAIRRARAAHVPVFTALVGTELGVVEVQHIGGFVERIEVPPDSELLRRISGETGGRFFEAPEEEDVKAVHADLKSRLARVPKDTEISVGFAAGAAVLLLVSTGLALFWFRRVT